MKCAWNQLLAILPKWMQQDVDKQGGDTLQELRLRKGFSPELICSHETVMLSDTVTEADLGFIINAASRYSPWAAQTIAQGYLTASGGHRIGVCGEAVIKDGRMTGIRSLSSLCIRVSRDITGLIGDARELSGSVLIIGSPGSGKTTLLRELIRFRSEQGTGSVGVVDERGEIFPAMAEFTQGSRTDVLSGCTKAEGIEMLLRTMGPQTIAVDEVSSERDCQALIKGAWCGVFLLATAHAASKKDLLSRSVYRPLVREGVFDQLVILQPDKSWKAERMTIG